MNEIALAESEHSARTRDGWELALSCVRHDVRRRHPVLIVPGYAMNTTVLEHHPGGPSLVATLVDRGYEVWTLNLRGTTQSRVTTTPGGPVSLAGYVQEDLAAALDLVRRETAVECRAPFCIGTSLGGSIVFGHLALAGTGGITGVVAVGAPLRWDAVHPLLRSLFRSRRLARIVPMRGVRRVARAVMPPLARVGLLGIYVNRKHLDLDRVREMTGAVEDPTPRLNEDIAEWMRSRDLYLDGINVTRAMGSAHVPLFVVCANRDGLVPAEAARSAAEAWGGSDVEVLEVGSDDDWYSHADMLIAHDAVERVFLPIADWLDAHD